MTPAIVAALQKCEALTPETFAKLQRPSEPPLREPSTGNPITHSQLIDLSKLLKQHASDLESDPSHAAYIPFRLQDLLRGTKVYVPPPPPKPEPTSEYKALMAHLRKQEEARAYERMLNPAPQTEMFSQRYPVTPNARFHTTAIDHAEEEDEATYADVNRQLALIANVLISIIACSVAIWMAARHWSAPTRLGLSMTGSGVVAAAEVVIYSGYIRRVREAKATEKAKVEVKEVAESWIIEGSKGAAEKVKLIPNATAPDTKDGQVRFRHGKQK
ncbi:hypothetical protein EJ05DRAFT_483945 [Pseudovirgaria hyperparasitica]|uniref:ATPase, vacuolar ER assembly factor, Vma12 n=1 Tax=Pseudovirgaria hyperparasitica TaxID=470096 RepID=A0A6A6WBF9_9PEZI|nr:uncharacterized protein EJ05DRAFT_483945 [Pseudovirgaria hyperparasitica]KAF2760172.1 hypothetical protein EJ05DRAFT_483945 [Pseudovirgaria hyperparasitica]